MNAPSIINNNEIIVQSIASCIFDDRIWNLKTSLHMENSVDCVFIGKNSPDRDFGTKGSKINQNLCN